MYKSNVHISRAKIIDTFLQNILSNPRIIRVLFQYFVTCINSFSVSFCLKAAVGQFVTNR